MVLPADLLNRPLVEPVAVGGDECVLAGLAPRLNWTDLVDIPFAPVFGGHKAQRIEPVSAARSGKRTRFHPCSAAAPSRRLDARDPDSGQGSERIRGREIVVRGP